jgi:tetratricopeptide (TPR) repeat protein
LGRETFEEEAGHFWGILETRPYMRARQGLAVCLWELGEREEAIEHYREILDLNPGDNQGIRHELAGRLLDEEMDEEMDEELGELLERYEEDAPAFWDLLGHKSLPGACRSSLALG